ncbi:MAG: STAS domain-containing protein [Actinomycetota bacterium]|nr:STAS domain-containing protein [Actinomycetota bacterium]
MSSYKPRHDENSSAPPRVEVTAVTDDTMVLALSGEHDLATKPRLLDALAAVRNKPNLIVDLSPCTFLDSTIIGVLLTACPISPPSAQRIALVVPESTSSVNRAVSVIGLRDLLVVHETIDHALRSIELASEVRDPQPEEDEPPDAPDIDDPLPDEEEPAEQPAPHDPRERQTPD